MVKVAYITGVVMGVVLTAGLQLGQAHINGDDGLHPIFSFVIPVALILIHLHFADNEDKE